MMKMEDIKRVQLSEITELITKGTTPTTLGYDFQDEGVNFLKIECFSENGDFIKNKVAHISEECHEKLKRSQLRNGDILFSIAGAIGRVASVTEDMLPANTNQALAIIRIADEDVHLPYIKRILTSPIVKEQFEKKKQGVAQLNLSLKDIGEISIPLPSKEKQIELAELFEKVNGIIIKRNKELMSLDNLIKVRFVEMFGDYHINDKGFEIHKGSELFKFSSGKFLPEESRLNEGIPVYGGNGIAWYTDSPLVDYPTVVIGRVGAWCGNVHMVKEPVWITDNAIYIKEQKTNKYTLEFLTELMKVMDFHQYADFSGQPKITQKPLESLEYLTPPVEMQNEFAEFVHQVDKLKAAVQKSLDETQLLFESLMQKYFG